MKFIQIKIILHNITHVLKKTLDTSYILMLYILKTYLNFKYNDINLKLISV